MGSYATRKWSCCGGKHRKHRHADEPGWCYCVHPDPKPEKEKR